MGKSEAAQDIAEQPHTETIRAQVRAVAAGESKDIGGVAGKRLKSFIERVERLEQEKAGLAEDIKEIFAEAKGTGFETKIIKRIIKLRKMAPEKRSEEDELLALYKAAIGMD